MEKRKLPILTYWVFYEISCERLQLIDKTVGLRVSREEELRGLDIGEHGMEAYGGFQIFSTT